MTTKCRCCKNRGQQQRRPGFLNMGKTNRMCDKCFRAQKLVNFQEVEWNKSAKCRCCNQQVAKGHIFKNEYLICLKCMYPHSHLNDQHYSWSKYIGDICDYLSKYNKQLQ